MSETLTDIRLRNMMFDSGTPLLISRDIAFTAEFPDNAIEVLDKIDSVLFASE